MQTRCIDLTIYGEPMAKQSVRQGRNKKTGDSVFYQPKKFLDRENEIKKQLSKLIDEAHVLWKSLPIKATITYVYEPPKSASKKDLLKILSGETFYKITSPDLGDNLNKLILDVMQKEVYQNDSEICSFQLEKVYGTPARTEITLELINTNNYFKKNK